MASEQLQVAVELPLRDLLVGGLDLAALALDEVVEVVALRRAAERGLEAGEPNADNLYDHSYEELTERGLSRLPATLLEAVDELEQDDVIREALGRGRGEDYVDYYSKVKRDEWFRYHEQVSAWEISEYLTRF